MPTKKVNVKLKISTERFYSEENSFGIYVAQVLDIYDKDDNPQLEYSYGNENKISIKGTVGKLPRNEEYVATLEHEHNDKYKGNYKVLNIYQELPKDYETQKLYFKALLTPNQFASLIEVYEDCDLIELFKSNQIEYQKVHGLGEKRYNQIRDKILSSMDLAEVIAFAEKYSIPLEIAKKYAMQLGNPNLAVQKISKNPYVLIEMDGIGFVKADKIASKIGIQEDSPFRVKACLKHVLQESNNEGHTWIGKNELVSSMMSYLDIKESTIVKYIDESVSDEKDPVTMIDGKYTTESVLCAEANIAKQLKALVLDKSVFIEESKWKKMVDEYCEFHGYKLHENQTKFLMEWNKNRVNLLIGYGGSGKTFIQNVLIGILEENELYSPFALLAPTGRASKVIANYTNKPASTIHRRIPIFDQSGITEQFIIVDESSMCDVLLSSKLLSIMENPNLRILFVGDDFQIPSVGVGNFLYDMIHSGVVNTVKLTQVFRQEDGGIKDITYKIRNNERFLLTGDTGRKKFGEDCVFWLAESQYLLNGILKNYQNILKKYNEEDIMIITPTNKGSLGTVNINNKIQEIVNPESNTKNQFTQKRGDFEITLREGDLVMNTQNTYGLNIENVDNDIMNDVEVIEDVVMSLDVFNGDVGRIKSINTNTRDVTIDFDGHLVVFEANIVSQLMHGWCITIHKSQGSQAKAVVLVLDKSATFQLNANLVYTGMSRASEVLLVLGQEKVINNSLRKFQNMERRSFLKSFLSELDGNSGFKLYGKGLSNATLLNEIHNLSKKDGIVEEVKVKKEKPKNRVYY